MNVFNYDRMHKRHTLCMPKDIFTKELKFFLNKMFKDGLFWYEIITEI